MSGFVRTLDYRAELNQAQFEAVTTLDRPVLVVAGAGSGKTRTLVYRVAYLVERGVPPESILLLTFTRKAAAEMLGRAVDLVGLNCDRVSGGTFHHVAHQHLRRWAERLGFPSDFSIMDRGDMEELLGELRKQAGVAEKDKRFPKRNTLADIISKANNKVIELGEFIAHEYVHLMRYANEIKGLAGDYVLYKQQNAFLDLDDLLFLFARLLREDEEVRSAIAGSYQYIMVDEFQDTNLVQAEIVRLLGQDHGNVMAVGDEAQSIYSFRGASFRNIMDFPNNFPGTRIIRLEENYRSTQPILDLTNYIISQAREKYDKKLFTRREDGRKPRLVPVASEAEQSLFICAKVRELMASGVDLPRIAVLFRAARYSFNLEVELLKHNIDFVKYGGRRFLEKAHIRDLLAILRVLANPGDGMSLTRTLLQLEGVGPKRASEIAVWIGGQRDRLMNLTEYPGSAKIQGSLTPLAGLFAATAGRGVSLKERIDKTWDFYRPIMENKFDDYPDRAYDIQEFLRLAEEYQSMSKLLADMALEPPDAAHSGSGPAGRGSRLVLSTVHSAKGLEWHTVFIIWASYGRFPAVYARRAPDDLEEERRLMYVAATRAEENLYFIYPPDTDSYTSPDFNLTRPGVSRFLADVPADLFSSGPERSGSVKVRTAPRPEPPAPPPAGGFSPNDRVVHRSFGLGRVIRQMSDRKVRVDFDHFGLKTLHLDYAGLKKV